MASASRLMTSLSIKDRRNWTRPRLSLSGLDSKSDDKYRSRNSCTRIVRSSTRAIMALSGRYVRASVPARGADAKTRATPIHNAAAGRTRVRIRLMKSPGIRGGAWTQQGRPEARTPIKAMRLNRAASRRRRRSRQLRDKSRSVRIRNDVAAGRLA